MLLAPGGCCQPCISYLEAAQLQLTHLQHAQEESGQEACLDQLFEQHCQHYKGVARAQTHAVSIRGICRSVIAPCQYHAHIRQIFVTTAQGYAA